MRGWTWIEPCNLSDEEMEKREPKLNALAAAWSHLYENLEQRGFRRQAAIEAGDYDGPDPEDEEEAERYALVDRMREAAEQAQFDLIEEELSKLGARMMRPYEHWNEDERYMEYMESRYDY